MRVVTNDKLIERNKRLAQILFFASIAALLLSFFLGNRLGDDPDVAFYFQCVMVPILLGMVVASVRMTNLWVRQPAPWDALREGLKGIGTDATLYNFVMPAPHVLVSPMGIFTLTTRFQEAPQKVLDDKWITNRSPLTYMRQEQIGNPTKEAKLHAARTEAFLQELLGDPNIKVQPLIVFVHPNANVAIEGQPSVPILYANPDKKKDALKSYLREIKKAGYPTLTSEQQAELDDVLLFTD